MTTETMTVHEGLCELKMLNKRISSEIQKSTFVLLNKHSNTKINGKTIKATEADISSNFQSIKDMISRRTAIKRALTQSNASTMVEIGGKTMSVAEAIEYRDYGIDYLTELCDTLATQFRQITTVANRSNGDALTSKADDYVKSLFGAKETEVNPEALESTRQKYIETNTYDIIDPLNAESTIRELQNEIESFTSKVDSRLSVSNALTTITITY